ncbi:MAG: hypothetical protein WC749_09235, partial [Dehalococcoidia bacterium]
MRIAKILLHSTVGLITAINLLLPGMFFMSAKTADAATLGAPSTIGYQGRLKSASSGAVVSNGTYYFRFYLYDASTGGTQVTSDTATLTVTNGYFSTNIDLSTDVVDFVNNLWMEIGVSTDNSTFDTMTTRVKLNASAYSFVTRSIENSASAPATDLFNGRMYFNTTTGKLNVYSSSAWVGVANTLDDAYNNFGAAASKITVDASESQTGGLEFELTTPNLVIDTQSTGDFVIQDAGSTWAQFTDGQAFDVNGTGAISLDADAASNFNTSVGDLTVDSEAGSLIFSAGESATDSIYLLSDAGGIDITAAAASAGEDIDISAVGSSVNLSSTESAVDSIVLTSTLGGIDILASGASAGEDIDIYATGSSVNLTSTENAADSLVLTSTLGGIDITTAGASAGEDIDITATGSSINLISTEASSAAIRLDADATAGAGIQIDVYDATNNTTGAIVMDAAYVQINTYAATGPGSAGLDVNIGDSGSLSMSTSDGSVSIDGGGSSGSVSLTSAQNDVVIDTQTAGRSITIGNTAVARAINIGTGNGADTVNLGTGNDMFNIVSTETTNDTIDINFDSLTTANGIDYSIDALTIGNAWKLEHTGTMSGNLYLTTTSGAWTGKIWQYDDTGNADWTGNIFDVDTGTGNHSGDILNVNLEASTNNDGQVFVVVSDDEHDTAGWLLDFDSTEAWTGIAMDVDIASDAAEVSTGNFFDVTYSGGAHTGNAIDLNMGTDVAGDALNITTAATTGNALDISTSGVFTNELIDINTSAAWTGNLMDVDVGTAIATGNVFDVSFAGAAQTGNAIDLNMGTNLAGQAIDISLTGVRTDDGINIDDDSTGNTPVLDMNISGIRTGNALDITYSVAAATENALDLNMGTNLAGDALNIATAATTGNALDITTSGIFTNDLIDINVGAQAATGDVINIALGATAVAAQALVIDSTGASSTDGWVLAADNSGNGVWTGNMIDVTTGTGDATGNLIDLAIEATTAGDAQAIVVNNADVSDQAGWLIDANTTGIWTGNMIDLTSGAQAATGNYIDINVGSAAQIGDILNTNIGALAVALQYEVVDNAAASTTDGWLIDANTTGAWTGTAIDADIGTAISTGNFFDVTYANVAHTGNAIDLNMGTNLAGQAIDINLTGIRTDDGINIDDDSTGNTPVLDMNISGIRTGNALDITYSVAAATENALDLNMGTNVAGDALNIALANTTGNAIDITDSTAANTSSMILLANTATDVTAQTYFIQGTYTDQADAEADFLLFEDNTGDDQFLIATDGNTTITGTADGTDALTLTTGDILVSDGDLDLSGGDFNVALDAADGVNITKGAAPTVDVFTINGSTSGTAGVDALQLTFGTSG